jgi:hypothetical protein
LAIFIVGIGSSLPTELLGASGGWPNSRYGATAEQANQERFEHVYDPWSGVLVATNCTSAAEGARLLGVGSLPVDATANRILLTGLIVVIPTVAIARMTVAMTSPMLFLYLTVAAISAVFIAIFVAVFVPIAVGLVLYSIGRFVNVFAGVGVVLNDRSARARVSLVVG